MKDYKNDSSDALSRFAKDKRLRTVKTVKTEYVAPKSRTASESDFNTRAERPAPRRKSFNPNFNSDNRPVHGDRPSGGSYGRKYDAERPAGREWHDDNRQRSFGEHSGDSRQRSFGEHSGDNRQRSFGEHSGDNRRPSSAYAGKGRTYGNDAAFGGRPAYGRKKEHGFGSASAESAYGDERRDTRPRKGGAKHPAKGHSSAPAAARAKSYPKYNAEKQTGEIRLNRFIAQSGLCSRREADSYITAGLVTVNGRTVTELGTKILPTDEVKFNNEKVQGEHKVYLVLNKPKGYVTTLEDPHATKIVSDLVKNACTERIYPVGRLDKNSLGLLLFTNDGDLTRQLTHPSYQKKKIYQVRLDKPLTRADMQKFADGITLEDGEIYADEISYVKDDKKEIGIEIHSGRNRIVRRMFEHLGYTVQKLDRVYYAGLTKKNLKRGAWRFLTKEEVMRLKSGMYE